VTATELDAAEKGARVFLRSVSAYIAILLEQQAQLSGIQSSVAAALVAPTQV
jgi:hypothetical protein